jgi:Holliday junction resolvase RusA-like endonuclease
VWVKIEVDTAKDIDAIIKPVLDILQDCGVFENDKQVTELKVSKNTISNKKLESLKIWVCEV